jgi:hypothetical protein
MVSRVNQAVEDARHSPQGERLRAEAEKTAESLRAAGEQTWQEAQPHLLAALSKINTELKQVIDRMERRQTPSDSSDAEGTPGTAEEQATGDA